MNPLELRKQILIAESEINRAHLVHDWHKMEGEVHALTKRFGVINSMASSVASLIGTVTSLGRKNSAPAAGKTSWLQTILKGAQMAGSLWSHFRSRPE